MAVYPGLKGIFRPLMGVDRRGLVVLSGTVTLAAGGTVSAYDAAFTIAKTAGETGRYTITLDRTVTEFAGGLVTLIGADDAAYTTANGVQCIFRDNDLASDGTIELQFIRSDTAADAEIEDSRVFKILLFLFDSNSR